VAAADPVAERPGYLAAAEGRAGPLKSWLVGLLIRNLELLKPLGARGGIKTFGAVLE